MLCTSKAPFLLPLENFSDWFTVNESGYFEYHSYQIFETYTAAISMRFKGAGYIFRPALGSREIALTGSSVLFVSEKKVEHSVLPDCCAMLRNLGIQVSPSSVEIDLYRKHRDSKVLSLKY